MNCQGHGGPFGADRHCHFCFDVKGNTPREYPGDTEHALAVFVAGLIEAEPAHVRMYPDLYAHKLAKKIMERGLTP